jgi:hypothetical protein
MSAHLHRSIAVPLFCALCLCVQIALLPDLRLPLPLAMEDFLLPTGSNKNSHSPHTRFKQAISGASSLMPSSMVHGGISSPISLASGLLAARLKCS